MISVTGSGPTVAVPSSCLEGAIGGRRCAPGGGGWARWIGSQTRSRRRWASRRVCRQSSSLRGAGLGIQLLALPSVVGVARNRKPVRKAGGGRRCRNGRSSCSSTRSTPNWNSSLSPLGQVISATEPRRGNLLDSPPQHQCPVAAVRSARSFGLGVGRTMRFERFRGIGTVCVSAWAWPIDIRYFEREYLPT